MTDETSNHRETGRRKLGNTAEASNDREARDRGPGSNADLMRKEGGGETGVQASHAERVDDTLDAGPDGISHDALREAGRLGTTDAYLVEQDMEDSDERQGEDGPDGRPSPLANADNPER